MFKVIIAGGRDFTDQTLCNKICDKVLSKHLPANIEVVCGKAKGADTCGEIWAKSRGIKVKEMPADWNNLNTTPCRVKDNGYGPYNALAGTARNHAMGDYSDALLAIWDESSKGTKDMINYSIKLGLKVLIFDYEGEEILWLK